MCARAATTMLSCVLGIGGCQAPPSQDDTSRPDAGGKSDLPNGDVDEHDIGTAGYRAIAQHFRDAGYDLTADPTKLDAIWPLHEEHTVLLSRFGTPVQNAAAGFGWYLHDAADVARSSADVDQTVRAPISGYAKVFDWNGGRPDPFFAYSSVVAIYDPQSHLVVQLMHVTAHPPVRQSAFEYVEQGQIIGRMADPPGVKPDFAEAYVHTHMTFIDGASMRSIDPVPLLPYRDSTAPEVLDVYLLDDTSLRHDRLIDGNVDIVLEVADLDDDSGRNFEPAAIAFEVVDDAGHVLARSERCDFRTLLANIQSNIETPVAEFLDFGNAAHQIGPGGWSHNDQGYPENTYRYALTQFRADPSGTCTVLDDADGFVPIEPDTATLEIRARLWDPSGNMRDWTGTLER